MIEPNILAFQNAALLEALEADQTLTLQGLADRIGRDNSNTLKTLKRLTAEGLLHANPLSTGLTDEGRTQLAAFKRAKHGGERRRAKGRWPLDKFRRNPTNRRIDPDAVLGLADAIAGVGDILVPLVASMPDEEGVRTIWAGERRWMAATRLVQTGELPEALLEGLPFNEREADKGEAALITLVENGSRTDLTPWEDAQQLRIAADATGLNATELARRIGRARDGDRGGLRDVQAKIKVAREAEPEAIAAYEADPSAPGAWEALRDSVSKPKPKAEPEIVLIKAQQLALAELYHKGGRFIGREVAILPAGHAAEGARLGQYGLADLRRNDNGDTARITAAGHAYLQAEGLSGSIENARARLGFPEGHGVARYRTEWLNTPVMASAEDQLDPEVVALAGIEPISRGPLTAEDFGVPAGFTCFVDGKYGNDAYAVAAEWIEPGSLETFVLPHMKGQRDHGFPRTQIQIARIKGSDGWIQEAGYSIADIGHHADLKGVSHGKQQAWPTRGAALAAAGKGLLEGLTRNLKKGPPSDVVKWLDRVLAGDVQPGTEGATRLEPADPLIVNGVRHPNLARANEARRAAGILPRQSNSGGGAHRAPEPEPDAVKSVIDCPINAPDWRLPWVSFFERRDEQGGTGYAAVVRHSFAQTFEPKAFDAREAEALASQAMHVSHWFGTRLPTDVLAWLEGLQTPTLTDLEEPIAAVADGQADAEALAEILPPLALIRMERERQKDAEGWTAEHDDEVNGDGELAYAACAYAAAAADDPDAALFWPKGWDPHAYKPTGTIRDLVKAGALILAEIERRQRNGEA